MHWCSTLLASGQIILQTSLLDFKFPSFESKARSSAALVWLLYTQTVCKNIFSMIIVWHRCKSKSGRRYKNKWNEYFQLNYWKYTYIYLSNFKNYYMRCGMETSCILNFKTGGKYLVVPAILQQVDPQAKHEENLKIVYFRNSY